MDGGLLESSDISSDPIHEQPKKGGSVFDRLYADSSRKPRRKNEEEPPKKVEKPKKKPPPRKERSVVEPRIPSVSSTLDVENEKPKRLSVYDRLYQTTTESRRAQQKNSIAEQIVNERKTRQTEVTEQQENDEEKESEEEENVAEKKSNGSLSRGESEQEPTEELYHVDFTNIRASRPKTAREIQKMIVKSVKNGGAFRRLIRVPAPLIERESMIQAAVPILPRFLARIYLVMNVLIPGTGTICAGTSNLCCGAPRFALEPTTDHRLMAFFISLIVGISQMVTVLFCLVGWCWSVGWGIIMVTTADSYRRLSKIEEQRRPTISLNSPTILVTTEDIRDIP